MQARLAIASLVLAIVLGLLTAWAYAPRSTSQIAGPATPFASFDPIGFTHVVAGVSPDSKCTRCDTVIRLDPALGVWLYQEIGPTDREAGPAWPVDEGRVRGLARLLADLARAPIVDAGAIAWTGPSMRITSAGQTTAFRIAESLGGTTLIAEEIPQASGSPRLVVRRASGDWNALLARPSLAAWRVGGPMLVQPVNVTRIAITTADRRMILERRDGRWGLSEPAPAPADPAKVAALLDGLAATVAERFVDDAPTNSHGLDRPAAMIEVESALVQPDGSRRTLAQTLRIGSAADASAATFFAQSEASLPATVDAATSSPSPAWGPRTLILTRQAIESLAKDASAYISPRSVQSPPADIAAMLFERQGTAIGTLSRAGDTTGARGWTWTPANASTPSDPTSLPSDLAPLRDLATLLAQSPPAAVQVLTVEQALAAPILRVTAKSQANTPLETCDLLAVAATDAKGVASELLGVRVGRVLRVYDLPQTAGILAAAKSIAIK
jgi:hypothetical protein